MVPFLALNGRVQQHHAIALQHEVIPSLHHLKIQCVLYGVYTVGSHVCNWFAQEKYGRIFFLVSFFLGGGVSNVSLKSYGFRGFDHMSSSNNFPMKDLFLQYLHFSWCVTLLGLIFNASNLWCINIVICALWLFLAKYTCILMFENVFLLYQIIFVIYILF